MSPASKVVALEAILGPPLPPGADPGPDATPRLKLDIAQSQLWALVAGAGWTPGQADELKRALVAIREARAILFPDSARSSS